MLTITKSFFHTRMITWVIIGGIIGFAIHLVWHSSMGINLFSIGPHITNGTLYTSVGMAIGVIIALLTHKNNKGRTK